MNQSEFAIVGQLSHTGKYRNTLYLEPSKIGRFYIQKVTQITEFTRSRSIGVTLSGGIPGLLDLGGPGDKEFQARVAVTPMLQAIVAENAAREARTLIDLASAVPLAGELLFYVGEARITMMDDDLVAETAEVPPNSCRRITERRMIQEKILRRRDDTIRTVLLTFVVHDKVFASIATTEFIELGAFASYYLQKHFGILCTKEGESEPEVTFLDPLWIWHEAP